MFGKINIASDNTHILKFCKQFNTFMSRIKRWAHIKHTAYIYIIINVMKSAAVVINETLNKEVLNSLHCMTKTLNINNLKYNSCRFLIKSMFLMSNIYIAAIH